MSDMKNARIDGWNYEFDEASMKTYREILAHNKDTSSWEDKFVSNALDEIERLKSGTTNTCQDKDARIKELEAALNDAEMSYIGARADQREAEKQIEVLKSGLSEQCRINGMGAQRELALATKLAIAVKALHDARKFTTWLEKIDLDKALAAINAHGGGEEKE